MEVGRILSERYEILRPLAEGAMATVWVAEDKTNGTSVAVKTISMDAAGWRAEVRDRFMKEARLLARGKHEHLVAVRDVGETDDGFLFLVLDLLEGETLADHLSSQTRLGWQAATALAIGIARGVTALHRAGIVHRDLKPANIILRQTPDGVVPTIIDLGIGKASGVVGDPLLCATLTATGQVLGTPEYMSYEQALGQTDIDARADVWAIGVMLYEMIAGTRPFDAPNTNAVLAAIRRKDSRPIHEIVPDVPPAISQVVETCLNTNRIERFADADVLLTQLEAALAAPTVVVSAPLRVESRAEKPPLEYPVPTTEPEGSKKRSFVLPAVAVVVVAAGVGFFVLRAANPTLSGPAENIVDVKGSSVANSSASRVATDGVSAPSAAPQPQNTSAPALAPTTGIPKSTGSTKSRPPVSRVDEAGF